MKSAEFAELVERLCAKGARLEDAVRTIVRLYPRLAADAYEDVGCWPSSEPVFSELQRVMG